MPVGVPRLPGESIVATMRRFRAGAPWSSTLHSWTLLDSHDTARFRTVAGSREGHAVGIGLQMTTPGVPMLFAGDELGLEGDWGEDARRTMPWERPDAWDTGLFEIYRGLIALRRSSDALARGGLRYVHVSGDALGAAPLPGGARAARTDSRPVARARDPVRRRRERGDAARRRARVPRLETGR